MAMREETRATPGWPRQGAPRRPAAPCGAIAAVARPILCAKRTRRRHAAPAGSAG